MRLEALNIVAVAALRLEVDARVRQGSLECWSVGALMISCIGSRGGDERVPGRGRGRGVREDGLAQRVVCFSLSLPAGVNVENLDVDEPHERSEISAGWWCSLDGLPFAREGVRSEEHTSELQSPMY